MEGDTGTSKLENCTNAHVQHVGILMQKTIHEMDKLVSCK